MLTPHRGRPRRAAGRSARQSTGSSRLTGKCRPHPRSAPSSDLEGLSTRDQDFQQRLATALAALGPAFSESSDNEQIRALEKLEKADPLSFAALRDVVYEAYYTNPKVWALIGYRFRTGNRKTAPLEEFDTTLLARVQQLPRLYRETD